MKRLFYKKLIKRWKKTLIYTSLLGGLALFGLAFMRPSISSIADTANTLAQNNPKFFLALKSIARVSDIPFKIIASTAPDKLPGYQLIIDPQDLEKLNQNLPPSNQKLTDQYKVPVPANFIFGELSYPVEVRYRGDNSNHWAFAKKSWRINFKEQSFNGMQSLDLIIPEDRGYFQELAMSFIADKLDLITPKMQLVNLFINGQRQGVYLAAEHWSQAFLEIRGQSPSNNLYGENQFTTIRASSIYQDTAQLKKFHQNELSSIDNFAEIERLTNLLNKPVDNSSYKQLEQIVDIDNLARWQAHSTLMFSRSQKNSHNIILNFNSQSGKLEFIPWNVSMIVEDVASVPIDVDYNKIMTMLLKNDNLYLKRNQVLWNYLRDGSNLRELLGFIEASVSTARLDIYKDTKRRFLVLEMEASTKKFISQIENSFERFVSKLNSQRFFCTTPMMI